ncbi:MAG TPA: methyltransferase domain-containing protein [Methylomirabilota bacterium]|nr:methyltransferase domain-containing protein [Methylomirabilota bacterium]
MPAAGRDWLLPFYDLFAKRFGFDAYRRALVEPAGVRAGQRVLDIGCGTGSLVVLLARAHPGVEVVGLDPDLKALARAERKARKARVNVRLDQGFAQQLPYAPATFDHVFSSFMLHHLQPEQKLQALREVRRVLKLGGRVHVVDFGGAGAPPGGVLARVLHIAQHTADNFRGRIVALMTEAGLAGATEVGHAPTLFGPIAWYRATAS